MSNISTDILKEVVEDTSTLNHISSYLETVCNFLNNTVGRIEDYQVKFLLNWISELLGTDNPGYSPETVKVLSSLVEADKEDDFITEMLKLAGYES